MSRKFGKRLIRREISVAALLLWLVAGLTTVAGASGFGDIDDGNVHAPAIETLEADGILEGTECGEDGVRLFCPYEPVQRWVMAVWLARAIGADGDIGSAGSSPFADVRDGEWWAPYVTRIATVGVTKGCKTKPARYCPYETVTRAQMASFLSRAYRLRAGADDAGFTDVEGNVHSGNINSLATAGITLGCDTRPSRYCPGTDVTRAQMASFLHRARDIPLERTFLVLADGGLVAPPPPKVSARAWILYDDTFGQVLAGYKADVRRAIASTTKIVTALVVLGESELDDRVDISEEATLAGESEIGLIPHEDPWTVEELLAALLIRSANDAAVALAEHVGGSVEGFAALMNAKAGDLGLENSNFVNPHGLDHRDHYSSARDLLTLSLAAMADERFARIVAAPRIFLPAAPDGQERASRNRNKLLDQYRGAIGIKTGFTNRAVLTMVAAAERDGRRLYAVVLGSDEHYRDVSVLMDYGFEEFTAITFTLATSAQRAS